MTRNVFRCIGLSSAFCVLTMIGGCGGGSDDPFSSTSSPAGRIADTGGSSEIGGGSPEAGGGSPEAGGGSPGPGTAPGVSADATGTLTLSWDANSEPDVNNYIVFYGSDPDGATVMLTESRTVDSFDLNNPGISYETLRDLKLQAGQEVCFRVKAASNRAQSDYSQAACTVI